MKKYQIQTQGTAQIAVEADRFFHQDGFFYFVDASGNNVYVMDASKISNIALVS
jgi:beta-xylosidase